MTPRIADEYLPEIESVRGLAAFCVAFGHTLALVVSPTYVSWFYSEKTISGYMLKFLVSMLNPQPAVVLFFVISGLVLGKSLDGRGTGLSVCGYLSFLWRRTWRIYPAHLAALLAIVLVGHLIVHFPLDLRAFPPLRDDLRLIISGARLQHLSWQSLTANAALLSTKLNPVTWSLRVEMALCLIFPILHILARRAAGLANAAIIAALLGVTWHLKPVNTGPLSVALYIPAFYAGLLVADWGRRWSSILVAWWGGADLLIVVSWVALMLPAYFLPTRPPYLIALETLGAFSLLSLLVWSSPGGISRVLAHAAVRWSGRISYSFYLWHPLILVLALRAAYLSLSPSTFERFNLAICAGILLLTVGLAYAIASISYRWIEKPLVRFAEALLKSRPAVSAAETA